MRQLYILLVMLCVVSCGGGGGGSGSNSSSTSPPPAAETWTLFIYGHGDHNLTPSLAADMREMAAATIGSHVTVIVLADWNASHSTTTADLAIPNLTVGNFPTGAHWYRINGLSNANPIEYIGLYDGGSTEDLDDPAVLADAVASVFFSYPAQHRAMVLWNHGGGWTGGFGSDDGDAATAQGNAGMKSAVIGNQIYNGLTAAGVSTKLEFLGFDTCLMGSVEVMADLTGVTQGYVACAELDYGAGWDYTATLNYLSQNSYKNYSNIISAEVDHWDAHHSGNPLAAADNEMRAHAAWDLAQWADFSSSFAAFVDELYTNVNVTPIDVARGIYLNRPGYFKRSVLPGVEDPGRDLGMFFNNLANDVSTPAAVASKAQDVYDSADLLTINRSLGTNRSTLGQFGLSLELPMVSTQWTGARATDYRSDTAAWLSGGTADWADVLDDLKVSSDAVGPVISGSISNNTNPDAANQPTVTFSSADSDVVEARVSLELEVSSGVYYRAGLIASGIVESASVYTYAWDGDIYEIDNGTTQTIGAINPWVPGLFYSIKGKLNLGADSFAAWLLVKESDGSIPSVVFSPDGERFQSWPITYVTSAATFVPEWEYSSGGTVDGTAINFPGLTGSLDLVPAIAPAANYRIGIEMIDVWGNSSESTGDVTVVMPFGNG